MENDERKEGTLPEEPGKPAPKIEVQIVRHKQLFDILKNPSEMWRVLLSLFIIIVVLFFGLSCVVLSIKSIYPYNSIQTNVYGATYMKNEDKEVIYWLFNTAELWANSGIEVEAGDELTIRASGASHTAIHHLVEDVESNIVPRDKWVGTEGRISWSEEKEVNTTNRERDKARRKYRICEGHEEGKLLMLITEKDPRKSNFTTIHKSEIEIIGKGRERLRAKNSGTLYFAINDIMLTDSIIYEMYKEFIKDPEKELLTSENTILDALNSISGDTINDKTFIDKLCEANKNKQNSDIKSFCENNNLTLGRYPKSENEEYYNAYPLVNELVYYKEKQFRDAWYIDNLGSFLIVVERKKP